MSEWVGRDGLEIPITRDGKWLLEASEVGCGVKSLLQAGNIQLLCETDTNSPSPQKNKQTDKPEKRKQTKTETNKLNCTESEIPSC